MSSRQIKVTDFDDLLVSTVELEDCQKTSFNVSDFDTMACRVPFEYSVECKNEETALKVHAYFVDVFSKKPCLRDRLAIWLNRLFFRLSKLMAYNVQARMESRFEHEFSDDESSLGCRGVEYFKNQQLWWKGKK